MPAGEFTTITCANDRGREHAYELADTTVTLDISEGPQGAGGQPEAGHPPRAHPARLGSWATSRVARSPAGTAT